MKASVLLFLTYLITGTVSIPPIPIPAEKIKYSCNLDIMRSYMLKGRTESVDNEPHLTCPDIKNNCCTKFDQQKIYHHVNTIMFRRLDEYNSKVISSLTKIKRLHFKIGKVPIHFKGSIDRKFFCTRQTQRLIKFPFQRLYDKILSELELMQLENKEFYQKFFCVICDGANHRFFEFQTGNKQLTLDLSFCKEHLTVRATILKLLNVDFQEYLINLQHVVDCKHYSKSYNLKFFDMSKIQRSNQINDCLNFIETSDFYKYCKTTCRQIKFTKIFGEAEGDYDYLGDAVTFFDGLFSGKEESYMADPRMRTFLSNLMEKKGGKERKLRQSSHQKNSPFDFITSNKKMYRRNKKIQTAKRFSSQKLDAKIQLIKKRTKTLQKRSFQNLKHVLVESNQRVLETSSDWRNKQRVLDDASPTARALSRPPGGDPSYDKQIYPFYQEIPIIQRSEQTTIFVIDAFPLDFDLPKKIYQVNLGINPLNYNSLNFTMTEEQFYSRLFTKKIMEKMNVQVQYLVSDFTDAFWENTVEDLSEDFLIDESQFEDEEIEEEELGFFDKLIDHCKKLVGIN